MKTAEKDKRFLERLNEEARHYGWQGDYFEIEEFVRDINSKYGSPFDPLDLTPYGELEGEV